MLSRVERVGTLVVRSWESGCGQIVFINWIRGISSLYAYPFGGGCVIKDLLNFGLSTVSFRRTPFIVILLISIVPSLFEHELSDIPRKI